MSTVHSRAGFLHVRPRPWHRVCDRWLAAAIAVTLAVATPVQAATVTLEVYDANGARLSNAQARSLMTNGTAGWNNDALIHPTTLQNFANQPLRDTANGLAFDTLGQPAALAFHWPTPRGYSLLILDNLGRGFTAGGTINLTYAAALDVRRRLDFARSARPDYIPPSPGPFNAAYASAVSRIQAANAATTAAEKGKYGQLALNDLANAYDIMLADYGRQRRAAHTSLPTWFGFTIDTLANYQADVDLAKSIGDADTWVRFVCDPNEPPATYVPAVQYAHSKGVKVLLEVIDSYAVKNYTRAQYLARYRAYIDAIDAEAYEVGNEINGSWLGTGVADKVGDAAAYARSKRPNSKRVATLFWEMSTALPHSMFNWTRANLTPAIRNNLDVILVSTYIGGAPLGLGFDQVFQALRTEFPGKKIGMGEADYWLDGASKAWWYVSKTDPLGAARQGIATQFYSATLGYDASVGGVFWWSFSQTMPRDPQLVAAIRAVTRSVHRTTTADVRSATAQDAEATPEATGADTPSGTGTEAGTPEALASDAPAGGGCGLGSSLGVILAGAALAFCCVRRRR